MTEEIVKGWSYHKLSLRNCLSNKIFKSKKEAMEHFNCSSNEVKKIKVIGLERKGQEDA